MSKKSPSVLDTVVSVVYKKEEHGDTVPKSIINSCKENDKGIKKEYEDFKNKGDARNLEHEVESVEIEEKFDTKCEGDNKISNEYNERIKEYGQMNENENKRKEGYDNMTESVQKKIKCIFPSFMFLKKNFDSDGNSHRLLHKVIQENDHDDTQQIRLSVTPVNLKTLNSLNGSETTQNELNVAEKNEEREKIEEDRKKIELKNTSQNELYKIKNNEENKDINSRETVIVDECGIIHTLPNKIGATYIIIRNDLNVNIEKFFSKKNSFNGEKVHNLKKDAKTKKYHNLIKEAKRKYYEVGVKNEYNGTTRQPGNALNKELNIIEINDNEENKVCGDTDSILNIQFPVSLQRTYTIYDANGISYKVIRYLTPRCIVKAHLSSKVNPN
ncbi:hypothetical protein QTP88_028915 [Uroleucon formosanum]